MSLQATTAQTVGPYFSIGLTRLKKVDLAGPGVSGERITLVGRVLDGDGMPVPDAVLEIWQANSHGRYAHPEDDQKKPLESGFLGYGRIPVDERGRFRLTTIKPGPVPGPNGKPQAPHIAVSVFMRGLLRRLGTRIYFPDEPANSGDFVLNLVEPDRRSTLIARKNANEIGTLEWNVILQGHNETVFFDFL
ncbi:MAG TPA: protocatechuate 3,4-dioxygenase subunit alpha [Candidatus Angelobacter sp.]|nr:protocatechuate 3,4-dioxygenase subunit alpha [Candidatus Angelobacter sp.]